MVKGAGKIAVLFFVMGSFLGVYYFGFTVGKSEARVVPIEGVQNTQFGAPESVDFSVFWDAWRVIQEKYAATDSFDYQEMVYGAVSGMVKSLGDPYTTFMDPEEAKRFRDDISGSFEGVGMEIGVRNGRLQVIAPLEGTPADKAGLRPGDRIVAVDGKFTLDMTIDEAVSLIRGQKGTTVVLGVFREEWKETRDIEIVRDTIKIIAVEWEMKEGNVGYIQLHHFSENAAREFQNAALGVLNEGATRIVLDLRNNPGGFLAIAVDIAGWFLERGQIVVIEDFGDASKEKQEYKARGNGKFVDIPVVVLINQGSASASEILAGALRDHRGVQLVGEQSFGKGSIQELENLVGEASLKVTVANWLTPAGHLIHGEGLAPDVEVEISEEDREEERDPQLDKALELVKQL